MFDPFEMLSLEKAYPLDLQTLDKHYFEAQKKHHPDRATHQEKADAIRKSTEVNQAYLTLKNPLKRAEYLLKAAGVETLFHDPSFLGTVMVWNERLEQGENLKSELLEQEKVLLKELENCFAAKNYEKVRVALYQLTYVENLLKRGGEL